MIETELQDIAGYQVEAVPYEISVSPWAPREWKRKPAINYGISLIICTGIVLFYLFVGPKTRHWCVLPLFFCGLMTASDFVAWLRDEMDQFDVKVFISGWFFLNCFLAPLMHLTYDMYGKDFYVSDWPTYFGYMGLFNAAGIFIYKLCHKISYRITKPSKSYWTIALERFVPVFSFFLIISLVSSLIIKVLYGGIVRREISEAAVGISHFLSVLLMLGDPAPTMIVIALLFWIRTKHPSISQSGITIFWLFVLIGFLQFAWVGLRGSRSAILYGVILIAGVIHYWLRPLKRKWLILMGVGIVIFAYLYSFYKFFGEVGWQAVWDPQVRRSLAAEGNRGIVPTLLGDFSRADLQALMVYRLVEYPDEYDAKMGRTYFETATLLIPRAIWPNKPPFNTKNWAGSELMGFYGESSRVYGLAGEAMLNFRFYGILPAFLLFGLLVGWLRKKIFTLYPSDSRFLIIPLFILLSQLIVMSDSDNVLFGGLKMGVVMVICVTLGSFHSRKSVEFGF